MDIKKIYRIFDANLNRAKEGLRVIEDYLRFYLDNDNLFQEIREIRHNLGELLEDKFYLEVLKERESLVDCGRNILEEPRANIKNLVIANIKRAEEALRVLEEYSKIILVDKVALLKNLRYKIYNLEKAILKLIQED